MIPLFQHPYGLRLRILLAVGVTTTVVMMLLSWGMLYSWKASLVEQEEGNAKAVSRAFSVAVIDALIFAEQDLYQSEGFLDNYVTVFMDQNPRLEAITILDPEGRTVARSWNSEKPPWVSGSLNSILAVPSPRTVITRDDRNQWVLETILPMNTGGRSWGVLVLATEANSIQKQIRRAFFQLALFSSSVTSILLLLLWLLLSRILSSLQVLVTAMDTLDFNVETDRHFPERGDEIGFLFKRFQRMEHRLDQSRKELLGAQKQVWHAERLASIGRLASGLAHEINNPINGVRNCIYAIRGDLDNKEQTAEYLNMMDEGLTSASAVIKKLLGFARKQQTGSRWVHLNTEVNSVQRLLAFDMERKGISLETQLDPDLPAVKADRQLLQEVIMNLLINATDASSEGGEIKLNTLKKNQKVLLTVQDEGGGIPEANLEKIFDPFFTTKKTGEGTGLGLSICQSIVQAYGGSLEVTSRVNEGSTFTITLPSSDDQESA